MFINKISTEMQKYINAVKATDFYKNHIETLYICEETPEILWAKFKAPYTKRDEFVFWHETEGFDFVLTDAEFAYEETDAASTCYKLLEVG